MAKWKSSAGFEVSSPAPGLFAFANARPEIEKKSGRPLECGFTERHTMAGSEVEAIPLPGHTLGFTAYRFDLAGTRFLISGDLLVRNKKRWRAQVPKLLRDHGTASLRMIQGLDVDFLLPNQLSFHPDLPVVFGPAERTQIIEEALGGS